MYASTFTSYLQLNDPVFFGNKNVSRSLTVNKCVVYISQISDHLYFNKQCNNYAIYILLVLLMQTEQRW